jgi:hypothetical protein
LQLRESTAARALAAMGIDEKRLRASIRCVSRRVGGA